MLPELLAVEGHEMLRTMDIRGREHDGDISTVSIPLRRSLVHSQSQSLQSKYHLFVDFHQEIIYQHLLPNIV